ncbi:hypothetical protein [Synechococcus sp. A15-127]|uniref:hypothetical protein n=1 Tax=Synechococcus sp. A15-127 TaxID=1050624 RepID=UPI00164710C8|nr:hypothetical protein [Synechococcus sp. A15-127]
MKQHIPLYISKSQIELLRLEAVKNKKQMARTLLHTEDSNLMQCMLIAFAANTVYPAFSDQLPGKIVFTCLYGFMRIDIIDAIDKSLTDTFLLSPGELLTLPRTLYRSTSSLADGCVFLESIEGPHQKHKSYLF